MDSITLTFTHKNDTKGTRRFEEVVEDGQDAIIGSLYVKKHFQTADTFTVTLEPVEPKAAPRKRTSK